MKIYYIKDDKCINITPHIDEKTLIKTLLLAGFTMKAINSPILLLAETVKPSEAVKPLIDILIDVSEPISYGFMVKGFILWMAGKENDGKKTIKASAIGYLGVQCIPQIFKIIKTIKLG